MFVAFHRAGQQARCGIIPFFAGHAIPVFCVAVASDSSKVSREKKAWPQKIQNNALGLMGFEPRFFVIEKSGG